MDHEPRRPDVQRSEHNLMLLLWGLGGLFVVFLVVVLFAGRS